MVMLSERARQAIDATQSTTFAMDLKKWLQIMETYEGGGHAYHTTLPTDALVRLHDTMKETEAYGTERVRQEQMALGREVRSLLERHGFPSVSAAGFQAPGVVVSYTTDPDIQRPKSFWLLACRPRPACRCSATNRPTSAPSASVCLGWTNGTTYPPPCSIWNVRWPKWHLRPSPPEYPPR
jgi:hypothetical protein